jgi:hypothetical protein
MSTENSQPIKTIEEWFHKVNQLAKELDEHTPPAPWPFPPPLEGDEQEPTTGALP